MRNRGRANDVKELSPGKEKLPKEMKNGRAGILRGWGGKGGKERDGDEYEWGKKEKKNFSVAKKREQQQKKRKEEKIYIEEESVSNSELRRKPTFKRRRARSHAREKKRKLTIERGLVRHRKEPIPPLKEEREQYTPRSLTSRVKGGFQNAGKPLSKGREKGKSFSCASSEKKK